jgi:intracellular septation protein A
MTALLNDLFSTLVFVGLYAAFGSIYLATAAAIAAGVIHVIVFKLIGRRIDPMQWLGLVLVVLFGGTALASDNPQFIMVKPSIIHFIVAAVMLRRGWLDRYLPPIAKANLSEAMVVGWGYGWAALMIALGVLNLIVAMTFDVNVWAWFVSFGAVGAKIVFAAAQYTLFRTTVRRRLLARAGG